MKFLHLIFLAFVLLFGACRVMNSPEITNEEIITSIKYLSSDSLKGRLPGTPEDILMQNYIASEFKDCGLEASEFGYKQTFDLITGVEIGEKTLLKYGEKPFMLKEDFYPASYSSSGSLSSNLLFCGYGLDLKIDKFTRNDFQNIDVKGKWALIFRGVPKSDLDLSKYDNDRDKAMLAADKGALGVILISADNNDSEDNLNLKLEHIPAVDIPVLQLKRKAVLPMFEGKLDFEKQKNDLQTKVLSEEISSTEKLEAYLEIYKLNTPTANVIGLLPGKDAQKSKEWIVIGAHHDHLGMGGRGNSSRMPDTIAVHNGADDNASGVAAVMELAAHFSSKENRLDRSLLFVTFGAEEKGLVGSKYFVENCPIPTDEIMSMINIDMIGRMSPDSILQIGGIGTSAEADSVVEEINKDFHLSLKLSEAGYGPSDHASFYGKDIPVFFFSTGAHQDYHTPFDDFDSLNIDGLRLATEYISELIVSLDQIDSLSFQEAGPKVSSGNGYTGSVTLGIMPDVAGSDKGGLSILAVTKGKPAYNGGIIKGDTIIEIDGNEIGNIYDYMYRLKSYKSGDVIIVTILRAQDEIDLLIQL